MDIFYDDGVLSNNRDIWLELNGERCLGTLPVYDVPGQWIDHQHFDLVCLFLGWTSSL